MPSVRLYLRSSLAVAAAALLAACAQREATLPSLPAGQPLYGGAMQRVALPDLTPPKCKGQKTTKQYASLTVTLSTKGGSFCIPEFGGFGGTVKYPSATPSVKLSLISSTTNYAHLPELGTGSAIFYLQLAISGGTTFGTNTTAGGGLTSKQIKPGKPYTAFGEAIVFSIPVKFTPCYAVATKGKYGGVIGGLGTLLKNQKVPVKASGFIEIYSGKQASSKC
jgi:hypothetical protein